MHPITQALRGVVATYQIPQSYFEALLTGMTWDLTPRRYATFNELAQYCYYVAGTVGLMAIRVFGCRAPESEAFARRLGLAFQLTNILRDLASDAARGRVYLPQDELAQFGVSEAVLIRGARDEAVAALLRFQGARARHVFAEVRAAIPAADRRALAPALAMAAVYERLLDHLQAVRYDVFSHPVRMRAAEKFWLAFAGAMRVWVGDGERRPPHGPRARDGGCLSRVSRRISRVSG